jgi:hypothetical protein
MVLTTGLETRKVRNVKALCANNVQQNQIDITEILLKVALNTINQTKTLLFFYINPFIYSMPFVLQYQDNLILLNMVGTKILNISNFPGF